MQSACSRVSETSSVVRSSDNKSYGEHPHSRRVTSGGDVLRRLHRKKTLMQQVMLVIWVATTKRRRLRNALVTGAAQSCVHPVTASIIRVTAYPVVWSIAHRLRNPVWLPDLLR
jgi:hypothetical protein